MLMSLYMYFFFDRFWKFVEFPYRAKRKFVNFLPSAENRLLVTGFFFLAGMSSDDLLQPSEC